MTELEERPGPVCKVGSSIADRVKLMSHNIGSCCYLALCSALLGKEKDNDECEDNGEWDIRSRYWRSDMQCGSTIKTDRSAR